MSVTVGFDEALDSLTWHCRCGYGNVATRHCSLCGREKTGARTAVSGPAVVEGLTDIHGTRGAIAWAAVAVVAVIAANAVFGHLLSGEAARRDLGLTGALAVTLGGALAFFALVGVTAVVLLDRLSLRARLADGSPGAALARGVVIGGGVGAVLGALSQAAGLGDPLSTMIAANGHPGVLLLGVAAIVLVGPVVEELVFRGLLGEALRGRNLGKRTTLWVTALAFSAAHLRLAQFRYYVWMGLAFGAIWWGRGLLASIGAHAAFNGALLTVAVLSFNTPATTLDSAAGASWGVPAGWRAIQSVHGDDLSAIGPRGATIQLGHVDGQGGVDADALVADLRGNVAGTNGDMSIDPSSVRTLTVDGRRAVVVHAEEPVDATLVYVPDGGRMWIAASRQLDDERFTELLAGLRLPPSDARWPSP